MSPDRSAFIKAFAAAAPTYNEAAGLQRRLARHLADRIAEVRLPPNAKILDIGCGTGFLADALGGIFPAASFILTDIAPAMVAECRHALYRLDDAQFLVMDGEQPCLRGGFDLVCSNFTIQWFDKPAESLQGLAALLAPGGCLAFTTLVDGTFKEWRAAHADHGVTPGTPRYLPLDALRSIPFDDGKFTVDDESFVEPYRDASEFLRTLKRIGAQTPAHEHRPLSPAIFRRILTRFEDGAPMTYHVAYGIFRRTSFGRDRHGG